MCDQPEDAGSPEFAPTHPSQNPRMISFGDKIRQELQRIREYRRIIADIRADDYGAAGAVTRAAPGQRSASEGLLPRQPGDCHSRSSSPGEAACPELQTPPSEERLWRPPRHTCKPRVYSRAQYPRSASPVAAPDCGGLRGRPKRLFPEGAPPPPGPCAEPPPFPTPPPCPHRCSQGTSEWDTSSSSAPSSPESGAITPQGTLPEQPQCTNVVLPNLTAFLLHMDYFANCFTEDRRMRLLEIQNLLECMTQQHGNELNDSIMRLRTLLKRRKRMIPDIVALIQGTNCSLTELHQLATDLNNPIPNINNLHIICNKPVDPFLSQKNYVAILCAMKYFHQFLEVWCTREAADINKLNLRVDDLQSNPELLGTFVQECNTCFKAHFESIADVKKRAEEVQNMIDRFYTIWRDTGCEELNKPFLDDECRRSPNFPDLTLPELEDGVAPGYPLPQPTVSPSIYQPDQCQPAPPPQDQCQPAPPPQDQCQPAPSQPQYPCPIVQGVENQPCPQYNRTPGQGLPKPPTQQRKPDPGVPFQPGKQYVYPPELGLPGPSSQQYKPDQGQRCQPSQQHRCPTQQSLPFPPGRQHIYPPELGLPGPSSQQYFLAQGQPGQQRSYPTLQSLPFQPGKQNVYPPELGLPGPSFQQYKPDQGQPCQPRQQHRPPTQQNLPFQPGQQYVHQPEQGLPGPSSQKYNPVRGQPCQPSQQQSYPTQQSLPFQPGQQYVYPPELGLPGPSSQQYKPDQGQPCQPSQQHTCPLQQGLPCQPDQQYVHPPELNVHGPSSQQFACQPCQGVLRQSGVTLKQLSKTPSKTQASRPQCRMQASRPQCRTQAPRPRSGNQGSRIQSRMQDSRAQSGVQASRSQCGMQVSRPRSGIQASRSQSGIQVSRPRSGIPASRSQSGMQVSRPRSGVQASRSQSGMQATNPQCGTQSLKAPTRVSPYPTRSQFKTTPFDTRAPNRIQEPEPTARQQRPQPGNQLQEGAYSASSLIPSEGQLSDYLSSATVSSASGFQINQQPTNYHLVESVIDSFNEIEGAAIIEMQMISDEKESLQRSVRAIKTP